MVAGGKRWSESFWWGLIDCPQISQITQIFYFLTVATDSGWTLFEQIRYFYVFALTGQIGEEDFLIGSNAGKYHGATTKNLCNL